MSTIVMVHGAFCGGWAFDRLRIPFEARGFTVHAPDLRGHGVGEPRERVMNVSMSDYADDIAAFCARLPETPILMGHSMGGLVAQMAARRTRVAALVLLAPSPPWGVAALSLEEAITAFGVHLLTPFSGVVDFDPTMMRHYCLSRMTRDEADNIIRRMRPESARATREVLNWWLDPFMTTSLGAGGLGVPALTLAGERDVVHSPATVRQTALRIGSDFEVMHGMSHWLCGEPGWEDIAERVLRWLSDESRAAA